MNPYQFRISVIVLFVVFLVVTPLKSEAKDTTGFQFGGYMRSGFGGGFENLALGQVARFSLAFPGGSIDELSSNGSVRPVNRFVLYKTTLDLTCTTWM